MGKWETREYRIQSESDIKDLVEELRKQLSIDYVRTDVTVFTKRGDTQE